jgi:hypothetical protein
MATVSEYKTVRQGMAYGGPLRPRQRGDRKALLDLARDWTLAAVRLEAL